MKPSSAALRALLATRQFFCADLYTFSGGNLGSAILRYCSGDQDITANGLPFSAGGATGPYFDRKDSRAIAHWKVGVDVDTLTLDVLPGTATVAGVPFLTAVTMGAFDGATFQVETAYMPSYGDTRAGTVLKFIGRIGEIDAGRSMATFNINSHLELLNIQMPRNLFQASCINNLGDSACTIHLSDFVVHCTALSGSTASVVRANVSNGLVGYFDQGKVTFTGGALSGLSRTVKSCAFGAPGTITLLGPFPAAPSAGDAFDIFPGCDKTFNGVNGCPKFSNVANFRGFPFVPVAETAI